MDYIVTRSSKHLVLSGADIDGSLILSFYGMQCVLIVLLKTRANSWYVGAMRPFIRQNDLTRLDARSACQRRGYWQPVSVVPPGANAAAVAAAVANGTAGAGAMTDVAGSMGSMGSMKPMDYGGQNSAGRGVNPWILN